MPEMDNYPRLRPAAWTDMPRIGHVAAQAFFPDPLMDVIHPHRHQFPNDLDLYWSRRARVHYWDGRWRQVVAVDRDENGDEVVVAIAHWERMGDGGKQLEHGWLNPRTILKPLTSLAMRLTPLLWPNRAADPKNEDILERTYPFIQPMWSGDRAESWYLELLAVHPDFQGKGIGRMLVKDGFARADRDGVCCSVISALGKEPFYQKCGYDIEDGSAGMGEGNPLAGSEGGRMFWRMPPKRA